MQTEDRADENMALQKPSFSPILYWLCSLYVTKNIELIEKQQSFVFIQCPCVFNWAIPLPTCFSTCSASTWPLNGLYMLQVETPLSYSSACYSVVSLLKLPSNQYSYAFFILASFVNHEAILGYLLMEDVLQSLMWLPVNLFLPAVSDFSEVLVATQPTCCPFHWLLLAALLLRHGSMCVEKKHRVCQIVCLNARLTSALIMTSCCCCLTESRHCDVMLMKEKLANVSLLLFVHNWKSSTALSYQQS